LNELYFTSAERGLDPGKPGYTVVGRTAGMSGDLKQIATGLSSFTPRYNDPNAFALEPVNCLHLIADGGIHVVSRIGACSADYTRRSNYLAHHMLLAPQELERCPGGPAELLAIPNFFMQEWTGEPREFTPRALPALDVGRPTTAGVEAAGLDVGWAEALADRLRDRSVRETFLVYPLGMDILAVLRSVLSHLTPEERWAATFTTYATSNFLGKTPAGRSLHARIKCVVAGDGYANEVLGKEGAFDLASRPAPPARRNIVPVAKPTTGVRARATVGAAVPRTTIRTEPAAWSGGGDDIAGSLQGLPDASTHASARSSRSGRTDLAWSSPWFVLPSLLSILMTGVSIWAILGWSGTQQELSTTILDLEKSRKDLGKKGDELSEIQAKLAEQQKRARKAEGDLEKLRTDAPTPEAAGNTSPTPAKEATTALPAPMASQQAAQPTATATPEDGGASKTANDQSAPETLTSDLPAGGKTPPARGETPRRDTKPQVIKDAVKDAIAKPSKPVTLVTGLSEPLPSDSISAAGPGADFIKHDLKKSPGTSKWQLYVGNRVACIFEQDTITHDLSIKVTHASPLLRFLAVTVTSPVGSAERIPLGQPLRLKLQLRPIGKQSVQPENIKTMLDYKWDIFSEDNAKNDRDAEDAELQQILELLKSDKNDSRLYYVIELPNACQGKYEPYVGKDDEPLIGLGWEASEEGKDSFIAGAMLGRKEGQSDSPLTFQMKGLFWKGDFHHGPDLEESVKELSSAVVKAARNTKGSEKDKLAAMDVAQAKRNQFLNEMSRAYELFTRFQSAPIPMRWKLCRPRNPDNLRDGFDDQHGLVIIDSLGGTR